jgi:hypothetical protein
VYHNRGNDFFSRENSKVLELCDRQMIQKKVCALLLQKKNMKHIIKNWAFLITVWKIQIWTTKYCALSSVKLPLISFLCWLLHCCKAFNNYMLEKNLHNYHSYVLLHTLTHMYNSSLLSRYFKLQTMNGSLHVHLWQIEFHFSFLSLPMHLLLSFFFVLSLSLYNCWNINGLGCVICCRKIKQWLLI